MTLHLKSPFLYALIAIALTIINFCKLINLINISSKNDNLCNHSISIVTTDEFYIYINDTIKCDDTNAQKYATCFSEWTERAERIKKSVASSKSKIRYYEVKRPDNTIGIYDSDKSYRNDYLGEDYEDSICESDPQSETD